MKLPFSLSFGKDDAVKTGRFLLYFILVYLVFSMLAKGIVGIETIELWVAGNVLGILSFFGQTGTVSLAETALIQLDSGIAIEISELCTGLMETILIVGAIIASIGLSWKKRLIGAGAALIIAIIFNHIRIVITTLLILGTNDITLIEFTHNILFRITLLVIIAGLYIIWFYWAASTDSKFSKKSKKRLNNIKT